MNTVNINTLASDTKICVYDTDEIVSVEEVLENPSDYDTEELYTVVPQKLELNAKDVLESAIDQAYIDNNMYDGWDDYILGDVTDQDIQDIQQVLERILSRSPEQNTAYVVGNTRVLI